MIIVVFNIMQIQAYLFPYTITMIDLNILIIIVYQPKQIKQLTAMNKVKCNIQILLLVAYIGIHEREKILVNVNLHYGISANL